MKAEIVTPPPPPDEVQLTLSRAEAEVLKSFAGRVAGDLSSPNKTRLFYDLFGNIHEALEKAGIKTSNVKFEVVPSYLVGYVHLRDRD